MKCIVGLSGGVDSSTVAFLMQQKGYSVIGCTLKFFNNEKSQKALEEAAAVADFLQIPWEVLDCSENFEKYVINYFIECYRAGITPSPCIVCNEFIKFKYLDALRRKYDADLVVTGHYARVEKGCEGVELYQGSAKNHDQSYFLYAVDREILTQTEFPLGKFKSKSETREVAKKAGIKVAEKPDSQDICFIQGEGYIAFIEQKSKKTFEPRKGNIVDQSGRILGRHEGIINYTVGQRKGLRLSGGPFFVKKIDAEKKEVTVTSQKEDIKIEKLYLKNVKFVGKTFEGSCRVKIRSCGTKVKAIVKNTEIGKAEVTIQESEYGAAKGQHCVFYDEDKILGGGEIY